MRSNYHTERLVLTPLTEDHAPFITELVNSPGWLRFIGDRNVTDHETAVAYIRKILNNANVTYWVVSTKDGNSAGVITVIKRDYLEHKDIGFAFLPAYSGMGYAYEAAKIVLDELILTNDHAPVLATTVPDNERSIQLLEKLGFSFKKQIEQDRERLLVYSSK